MGKLKSFFKTSPESSSPPATEAESLPSDPGKTPPEASPTLAFNPEWPSCPFIDAPGCPYTHESCAGCPYAGIIAEMNVPNYCPLLPKDKG